MDNSLYMLCLCTFCEHHGPTSILVTQAIPSDVTDQLIHESSQNMNTKSRREPTTTTTDNTIDTTGNGHNNGKGSKYEEGKSTRSNVNTYTDHDKAESVPVNFSQSSLQQTQDNDSGSNSNTSLSSGLDSIDQRSSSSIDGYNSSGLNGNITPFGPGISSNNLGETKTIGSNNNGLRNSEFCESCQLNFPSTNQYLGKVYGTKQNEGSDNSHSDDSRTKSKPNMNKEYATNSPLDSLPEIGCMRTTVKEPKSQTTDLWSPPTITMESMSYISTQNTLVAHHRKILKQSVFKSLSSEYVFERPCSSSSSAVAATSVLKKTIPVISSTNPGLSSSNEDSKLHQNKNKNQDHNHSRHGSNVLTSSLSHPAPFLFSSTTSSSTIALTFTLHDAVARGHRRKYGLLCLGSNETDVVKNWGMVTAWFERIAQILEMRCFEVWKEEVGITDDKEENIRRVINSGSSQTNYAQRSLKEISGSEDIFVEIHVWFSQIMFSLRNPS